jgi:hypothetical protein
VVFLTDGAVALRAVLRVGGWGGHCWTERLDGVV